MDIKEAVKQFYLADVESIRNLSEVANKLQAGGLTHSGNMNIQGKLNIGSNANSKDFPEWLTASVEHTGDSYLRLKTKNDDDNNIYLVNRDGHFRLKNSNGDMFGVNKDGHTYNVATSDNVHAFTGKGDNPYITLNNNTTMNKTWYIQYLKDNVLRFGNVEGPKLDIRNNGDVHIVGRLYSQGRLIS
jgi:hypothetical protein